MVSLSLPLFQTNKFKQDRVFHIPTLKNLRGVKVRLVSKLGAEPAHFSTGILGPELSAALRFPALCFPPSDWTRAVLCELASFIKNHSRRLLSSPLVLPRRTHNRTTLLLCADGALSSWLDAVKIEEVFFCPTPPVSAPVNIVCFRYDLSSSSNVVLLPVNRL